MYGRYTYGAFNPICINRNVLCISHDPPGDTMNPYYLVTKEELYMIKNDCKYPLSAGCDGCEYARPEETNPCTFIGANALMDEVLTRPYTPQAERKICFGEHSECPCDDECNTVDACIKQSKFLQAIETQKETGIRQAEREKVLKQIEWELIESCSENYEPSGMGCKCCPFLIVYDEGLECVIAKLRQKDGE